MTSPFFVPSTPKKMSAAFAAKSLAEYNEQRFALLKRKADTSPDELRGREAQYLRHVEEKEGIDQSMKILKQRLPEVFHRFLDRAGRPDFQAMRYALIGFLSEHFDANPATEQWRLVLNRMRRKDATNSSIARSLAGFVERFPDLSREYAWRILGE